MPILVVMTAAVTADNITLETLFSKFNELAASFAALQQQTQKKDAEIIALKALHAEQIQAKDLQILKLTHELIQLKKMVFGSRSERFVPAASPDQLSMGFEVAQLPSLPLEQQVSYTRKITADIPSKHQGRLPLPASLPRQQILLEPAIDITGMKKIGEEITEELEYAPGKLFVKQYIRPKYADPRTGGIVCAELPERPITKGIAGPALLSYIIICKFVSHLPVYRQIQQFSREGVNVPASTMNDWIAACCQLLGPLYQLLVKTVVASDYIKADETPIKVLDKAKKGTTARGYHWLYQSAEKKLVLFDYRPGRGREGPLEILKNFKGYLSTDGYAAYDIFDKNKHIIRLCCWAHVRRKYDESMQNDPSRAEYVLARIQQLYAIERIAKEKTYSTQEIKQLRMEKAVPILEELKTWLIKNYSEILPSSAIGKAIAYTLNLWDKLIVYVQDGRLQPDNNGVENSVRPLSIGRKNYLFAGSHEGAKRAAMLYSFMGSCKMNNINPQEWLTDILERIPDHKANKLDELLPNNWTSSQKQ
jgi:transposase